VSVEDCLRFALSQSVSTLVCGMDSQAVIDQNIRIAAGFEPMTESEQEALLARTRGVATDGRFEWFKSTQTYDSAVHRRQHGFPDP
jgi:predicted aldo/keto reductase-like oxidoreductase